jgi:hypothetical protein
MSSDLESPGAVDALVAALDGLEAVDLRRWWLQG